MFLKSVTGRVRLSKIALQSLVLTDPPFCFANWRPALRYINLFFKNAKPEPDFRYFSKLKA